MTGIGRLVEEVVGVIAEEAAIEVEASHARETSRQPCPALGKAEKAIRLVQVTMALRQPVKCWWRLGGRVGSPLLVRDLTLDRSHDSPKVWDDVPCDDPRRRVLALQLYLLDPRVGEARGNAEEQGDEGYQKKRPRSRE